MIRTDVIFECDGCDQTETVPAKRPPWYLKSIRPEGWDLDFNHVSILGDAYCICPNCMSPYRESIQARRDRIKEKVLALSWWDRKFTSKPDEISKAEPYPSHPLSRVMGSRREEYQRLVRDKYCLDK